MKPTTTNVFNLLNNNRLLSDLAEFKDVNPNFTFNELTVGDLIVQFDYWKEIIIQAIEDNVFEEQLTYNKRTQVESSLKSIMVQLQQLVPYKFNASNVRAVPMAQALFNAMSNLADIVSSSRLEERFKPLSNYSLEIKELSKQRRDILKLSDDFKRANDLYIQGKSQMEALESDLKILNAEKKQIQAELASLQKLRNEIEELNRRSSRADQEIETRKVKIVAFQEATNDYLHRFKELESDANAIVSKREVIDELILQAEHALNLKSAEGISAAFSSYYETAKENSSFRIFKLKFNWWILGAVFFLVSALVMTVWIVGGWLIENPDSVSSIVGRIVAVSISITGATFCARQYVGQKNIQEDYAYKSVLSKSIIAFTDEIRKRDDQKVVDYLTTVLSEIHKDPLRDRKETKESASGLYPSEVMDRLLDLLEKKH